MLTPLKPTTKIGDKIHAGLKRPQEVTKIWYEVITPTIRNYYQKEKYWTVEQNTGKQKEYKTLPEAKKNCYPGSYVIMCAGNEEIPLLARITV